MSILKLERTVEEFIQLKHELLPVSIFLMIARAKNPMNYNEIRKKLNVTSARASRNLSILLKLNLIGVTKIEPVEKKPVRKILFGLIHIGGSVPITQFSLTEDGLKLKKNLEKIWAS